MKIHRVVEKSIALWIRGAWVEIKHLITDSAHLESQEMNAWLVSICVIHGLTDSKWLSQMCLCFVLCQQVFCAVCSSNQVMALSEASKAKTNPFAFLRTFHSNRITFFFFFFKPLAAVSGMWQNAKEAKKPGNLIEGQQEQTASDEWLRHIMSLQHLLWSSSLETIHWNVSAHWGKQRSFSFVRKYAPTWGRIGFQDGVVVMLVVTM